MPKLGDTKKGKYYEKYIWSACVDCGKERWVQLLKGNPVSLRCKKCGESQKGEEHPNWKGGRKQSNGYILIWIESTSSYYSMCNSHNYIPEHRLVMAKHLGRYLESWEIVHHKNGIRDDNRMENLELLPSQAEHLSITFLVEENKKLKKRIAELEKLLS